MPSHAYHSNAWTHDRAWSREPIDHVAAGLGAVDRSPRRPRTRRKATASSAKTKSISPARRQQSDGTGASNQRRGRICAASTGHDGSPVKPVSPFLFLRSFSWPTPSVVATCPTMATCPTVSRNPAVAPTCARARAAISRPSRLIRLGDCGVQPPRRRRCPSARQGRVRTSSRSPRWRPR